MNYNFNSYERIHLLAEELWFLQRIQSWILPWRPGRAQMEGRKD